MKNLEENLRQALGRVEPPAGFADRVLVRVAREQNPRRTRSNFWLSLFGMGGLRWAAASALCVLVAASGALYERDVQRRRGEAAKEQLMVALRITGSKLQIAEKSLRELDSTTRKSGDR